MVVKFVVGLLVVSHSDKIAEGIKDLVEEMIVKPIPFIAVGGTFDKRLGTDPEKILASLERIYSPDGVLILYDFGSSLLSIESAVSLLDTEMQKHIVVFHTPLIDGSLNAAMEISFNKKLGDILKNLYSINQLYADNVN